MIFREAHCDDIEALSKIRLSVLENILSNPALISNQDYKDYLTVFGRGWLCEIENEIIGFAIVGLAQKNVWALFVHPDFEKKGIGNQLHNLMINWYFSQTKTTIWLSTELNTKAEQFYIKHGWTAAGMYDENEIKFEMSYNDWQKRKA